MKKLVIALSVFFCFSVLVLSNYWAKNDSSPVYAGTTFEDWQANLQYSSFDTPLKMVIEGAQSSFENYNSSSFASALNEVRSSVAGVSDLFSSFNEGSGLPIWDVIGGFIVALINSFLGLANLVGYSVSAFLTLFDFVIGLFRVVW